MSDEGDAEPERQNPVDEPTPPPPATLDYGRPAPPSLERRTRDRNWGMALCLLGVPALSVVIALTWGLYVGFSRNPAVLIGPVLLAALALWSFVSQARRARPDPVQVLHGFARGLLIVMLFALGLAGLLVGVCFVALG